MVDPDDPELHGRNMGVLQDFERRLEGAVEGFFARAFRSGIQPIELAKAVQRYALDTQHVTASGIVVPNVYRLKVSARDHERLSGFGTSLPRELAEVVVRTAAERDWTLKGPVKVRIEVGDDVRYGRYELTARVEAVEGHHADGQPPHPPQPPRPARPRQQPRTPRPQPAARDDGPSPAPAAPTAAPPATAPPAPAGRAATLAGDAAATLHLVARHGGDPDARVPVTGSRLTMGRGSGCDLTLTDATVSREHAALVRRDDAWWVVDLGSTNGTSVNGRRAAEHPVGPGDRLELGEAVVELVGG